MHTTFNIRILLQRHQASTSASCLARPTALAGVIPRPRPPTPRLDQVEIGPSNLLPIHHHRDLVASSLNLFDRRPALSRSNSRSASRSRDMAHHRMLSSLTVDMRSPTQGPTSNPAAHGPAAAHSAPSYRTRGTFLTNKRLFAYSPNVAPSGGISTDPVQGNVWLGTEEGAEVWSANTGELIGKVLVDEWDDSSKDPSKKDEKAKKMKGVSKVAFTSHGQALLLGGERLWRFTYGQQGENQVM